MKPYLLAFVTVCLLMLSCKISYKFNNASLDYSKYKTIAIVDFPNQAALVYPPLTQLFNETLKDSYSRQTRLILLNRNGDYNLEGAITNYSLQPLAIGADALASETRLTLGIRVVFTDNVNPSANFEKVFSANRTFPSTSTLDAVQDQLVQELVKEIVDQIFNETVATW
ncbi:MAG: LPS assembly lipoprotein LptE [Prevotellaceae bacterium]|jgi:hypothetical protein|nr:LPS assembly lipoprotein LptE [Prevotellaceae bacterium]